MSSSLYYSEARTDYTKARKRSDGIQYFHEPWLRIDEVMFNDLPDIRFTTIAFCLPVGGCSSAQYAQSR